MYLEQYGLTDFPFQLTPDQRFFFESTVHRKAMAHLLFGLNQGEGFIIITGEVGAGKTTLLCRLLETLNSETYVTGRIVSSHLAGDDMLRSVASAFDIAFQGLDKASLLRRIEDFLVSNHQMGKRTLLLLDEAQNVTPQALEELRMLSNFQVGSRVPLQSVMLAQPQFRRMLADRDLEQFRQRIVAAFHLGAMRADETREYIRHRLSVVGWSGRPQISEEGFADIFTHTNGVPRKINTFCSRLMLFCFLDDIQVIDREVVAAVAEDMAGEFNAVLEASDGPSGSTGIMHMGSTLPQGESGINQSIEARLGRLERMVDRHNRALHHLSMLGDSLRQNGKLFD